MGNARKASSGQAWPSGAHVSPCTSKTSKTAAARVIDMKNALQMWWVLGINHVHQSPDRIQPTLWKSSTFWHVSIDHPNTKTTSIFNSRVVLEPVDAVLLGSWLMPPGRPAFKKGDKCLTAPNSGVATGLPQLCYDSVHGPSLNAARQKVGRTNKKHNS